MIIMFTRHDKGRSQEDIGDSDDVVVEQSKMSGWCARRLACSDNARTPDDWRWAIAQADL
jgi:hypothetical protein